MRPVLNPRAGAAATGFFLGGLAISAAVALVTAPLSPRRAFAETVANPNDQPTARTLPRGISTVKDNDTASDRTGSVSAPRRLRPATGVIASDAGGRVDPLDHLSAPYRRSGRD